MRDKLSKSKHMIDKPSKFMISPYNNNLQDDDNTESQRRYNNKKGVFLVAFFQFSYNAIDHEC